MQFMGDLYVGSTLSANEYKIVEKVHNGKIIPNLYLLVFSSHPDHMLELVPEWEVLQKGYPNKDMKVIGIANGKKEALGLLINIIEDSLKQTNHADVRQFLKEKWEGQACR